MGSAHPDLKTVPEGLERWPFQECPVCLRNTESRVGREREISCSPTYATERILRMAEPRLLAMLERSALIGAVAVRSCDFTPM